MSLCSKVRGLAALGAASAIFSLSSPARAEWPSLDRILELARVRALSITSAQGEVAVANAHGVGARASWVQNPSLTLYGERGNYPQDYYVIGTLTIPLDINGQRGARIEEADRLVQWRQLGLMTARAEVTDDTISAYGDVITSTARVTLAGRAEEDAKKEAQFFAARLQAGDTTVYEKSLAEAEVSRWTQARAEAQIRVTQSMGRLSSTVGQPLDAPPQLDDASLPPALRGSWDDPYIAKIVDKSPGIQSLKSQQQYWAAAGERAERDKWAPLGLIVSVGKDQSAPTPQHTDAVTIGAGLSWAFPITRRNQGEVAKADAERTRAGMVESSYRKVLETRVRSAVTELASLRSTVASLDSSGIPAAEKVVEASTEAFRLGKVELSRVLLARRDLATARSRRLDLIEVAWHAYGDLAGVTGDLP